MPVNKRMTIENILGAAFFLGALFFAVRSITLCFSIDIWYDELFSAEFAKRPVEEMIGLTARDVHPPLYYMILHFFRQLLDYLGLLGDGQGRMAPEVLYKILSTVPFFVLIIYGLTTIRKQFGFLAAGAFSFAIISMPQMPEYTTEIRMYSYAMLFVTLELLHGYSLVRSFGGEGERRWRIPDGLIMLISSVAAAYTHYYAALAAGIIYGLILLWMLTIFIASMKKGRGRNLNFKPLGLLVISMNLMVILYIPWISVLFSQASRVKEDYWIPPMGFHSLLSAAKHLFEGYFGDEKFALFAGALFVFLIAVLFVRTSIRAVRKRDKKDIFTLCSFMVLPLLVTAGVAASVLFRPVFVNRYMIPAYGCFWLSVSIMASGEVRVFIDKVFSQQRRSPVSCLKELAGPLLLALVVLVGVVDYKAFIWNENYRAEQMDRTLEFLDALSPDTVLISNFDQVQALLSYYLNRNDGNYSIYLYQEEPEALIFEMVPGLLSLYDPIDIGNMLEGGKEVLFLGSFNSREDLLKQWHEDSGVNSSDLGSYLMERYWFEDFKLKNY